MTNCDVSPTVKEPVKDPARLPWNEVTKVEHYYLSVDAVKRLMEVRERPPDYRGDS